MPDGPRTPPIDDPPIRLAVCVSGGGLTLQNLIDRAADGRLRAQVVQVVASRPGIGAIARAQRAGIPCIVVERRGRTLEAFSRAVFDPIRDAGADLVVLGGFLCLVRIPDDFQGRVLNVHPSLIPAFCGQNFYGEAVHRAVLDSGVKLTGCTVHFADDTYDTGPIVAQCAVPVLDDDTPATVAARVAEAERATLPEAIRLYAEGRLSIDGRRVRVRA
jgi:phosphoribosylglycinamide formyltransferase-1